MSDNFKVTVLSEPSLHSGEVKGGLEAYRGTKLDTVSLERRHAPHVPRHTPIGLGKGFAKGPPDK